MSGLHFKIFTHDVLRALDTTRGNVTRAALLLGISRATLYRWLAANPQTTTNTRQKPGAPATLPFRVTWKSRAPSSTWRNRDVACSALALQGCTIERTGRVKDANGAVVGRGRALTQAVMAPSENGAPS